MIQRILVCALTCGGLASAAAAPIPPCAGPVEISGATITRVERTNDVLVMHDGRAIHLEGIRLPHANPDRAPAAIADQAYDALNALAKNHAFDVTAVPPKEDRYDRIRGQVVGEAGWLQVELLRRGLARVSIAPDRVECWRDLYEAEAAARAAKLGLWALPAYQIRSPDQLAAYTNTFQVVQGQVLSAEIRDNRAYLNFGPDWKTDFTVTISPDDMGNFRRDGVDPRLYAGKTIRVRGIIQQLNGPEIEVANPQQVEVVP